MEEQKLLEGQASDEQIENWKKEYGTVHEFQVGGKVVYLKKLSRQSVSLALGHLGKDFLKFGEALIVNNYIGGVPENEIIEDAELLVPICDELSTIVNGQKAVYVKH